MSNQDNFSELLSLVETFTSIAKNFDQLFLSDKFKIEDVLPWHQYYEISISELLYKLTNEANLHPEMMEYIFSDDPLKTVIEFSKQDSPISPPENPEWGAILSLLYALTQNYNSVLYHQQTIQQLLKKIQTGLDTTDKLLHKIIQIDKTAIYCKPIQQRIHQAQITGDEKFFKKLATAFKPRVLPEPSQDATLIFMIFFLLDIGGYQKMSEAERFELLIQFKQPHIDDASFKRKLYRIKNLYV